MAREGPFRKPAESTPVADPRKRNAETRADQMPSGIHQDEGGRRGVRMLAITRDSRPVDSRNNCRPMTAVRPSPRLLPAVPFGPFPRRARQEGGILRNRRPPCQQRPQPPQLMRTFAVRECRRGGRHPSPRPRLPSLIPSAGANRSVTSGQNPCRGPQRRFYRPQAARTRPVGTAICRTPIRQSYGYGEWHPPRSPLKRANRRRIKCTQFSGLV